MVPSSQGEWSHGARAMEPGPSVHGAMVPSSEPMEPASQEERCHQARAIDRSPVPSSQDAIFVKQGTKHVKDKRGAVYP